MQLLPRVRLTVARHPWIYWLTVAAVAGGIAVGVARALAGVDAARRSWGDSATVWVASTSIDPGQPVAARRREVPRAFVPAGALTKAPNDSTARQRLERGEIVTASDVAASGPAGLVPHGWVAFAVTASVEHFATGSQVSIYSGDQLLAGGLVVDDGESQLMVAVPARAAAAMAAAVLADTVTIGLTSGP